MADAQRAAELAYNYCLRRLTATARSEQELRTGLAGRGYEDDVIDAVLVRLRRAGYVDDEQYAEAWVRSRGRSKALAASVLRQELRRKGIDDPLIEAALTHADPEEEDSRAREVLRRRLPSPLPRERSDLDRLKRRLGGVLARKGFAGSRVWALVDEVLAEAGR